MVRVALLVLAMGALTSACSDSRPQTAADPTASDVILKRDCADAKWKQQNLGLWYSVCRQPMRW